MKPASQNQFMNKHLKQRRTKVIPQSQRSLEEIVVSRRQASELISEYERVSRFLVQDGGVLPLGTLPNLFSNQ